MERIKQYEEIKSATIPLSHKDDEDSFTRKYRGADELNRKDEARLFSLRQSTCPSCFSPYIVVYQQVSLFPFPTTTNSLTCLLGTSVTSVVTGHGLVCCHLFAQNYC